MRLLVIAKVFDTIIGDVEVTRARQVAGEKFQEISSSDKMIEGGVLGDARGAFFLLEVSTGTELKELLGPLHDFCHFETHPICSFEDLTELFKKLASK